MFSSSFFFFLYKWWWRGGGGADAEIKDRFTEEPKAVSVKVVPSLGLVQPGQNTATPVSATANNSALLTNAFQVHSTSFSSVFLKKRKSRVTETVNQTLRGNFVSGAST